MTATARVFLACDPSQMVQTSQRLQPNTAVAAIAMLQAFKPRLGGKATHAIRMAQPYSGPGYGMHLPLHQGAEVLLVHIDGDPDRPVIAATLANRSMPNPLVSPFGTRSVIQSRSAVRIEFDDDA